MRDSLIPLTILEEPVFTGRDGVPGMQHGRDRAGG